MARRHHECELFLGRIPEAQESAANWRKCEKNPGHVGFLSAPEFINNYLPRVENENHRKRLRSYLDLTVRLRVRYTSRNRPDDDDYSDYRGTYNQRVGTGFIDHVSYQESKKSDECHGRKQWKFQVRTALHVVFNTEEALETVVDVFYDDTESQKDGRMKSVMGVEVWRTKSNNDMCVMTCVTFDEDLGERIECAWNSYRIFDEKLKRNVLDDLGLQQSCSKDYDPVLIVSHPHAQPKQVTVGELRYEAKGNDLKQYTTPTCPGSSGAPVFLLDREGVILYYISAVHGGSYNETCPERYDRPSLINTLFNKLRGYDNSVKQLNYGIWGRL